MTRATRVLLLSALFALPGPRALLSQDDRAASALAGISNHGHDKDQPFVTAGDRAYLIGTQDGNFPDMGNHVPGEMGGLWLHPIKLLDGFWATVRDVATGEEVPLSESTELITYPYGSRLRYGPLPGGLEVERFQFSPDGQPGLIVQYTFRNPGDRERQVYVAFSVRTDLRPVWFSDSLGIQDAPDSVAWRAADGRFLARDTGNPWFALWGAPQSSDARSWASPLPTSRHSLSVEPGDSAMLTLVIAGSATDADAAVQAYHYLARNHARLLAEKKARYAAVLARARVTIPDRRLQEVYDWVKVNTQWLVRDVPGIGRGLGGGLMEYPWWFGTETYSLQALLASGDVALAKQTLRLLKAHSMRANGNGRILHELTTNGAVPNRGNTQETAQFILTVRKLVDWTGDLDFAREMYPAMKMGVEWLLTDRDRNRNLFPEGYGIMEVYGLNAELIDVAVYTQQALDATAHLAGILNEPGTAARYRQLASRLARHINEGFWAEDEGSYADFYGSKEQAVSAAKGAIRQIGLKGEDKLTPRDRELIGYYERLARKFADMPQGSRGWITNKNWVITTPMETGIAPRARALRLLDKIRQENVGEYGPFLSAVEKQAMMTISTGVQAVSEANYGRTDEAMWYVNRIVQTFNRQSPGSISEMMPDYGCFVIAWTSYGIVLPLIQHVFGIRPDAVNQTVVLEPHMPAGWEDVRLDDLPVGSNVISFSRSKTGRGIEYEVRAEDDGWTFVLKAKEGSGARYYLNGKTVSFSSSGIRMRGRKNTVLIVH